MPLIHHYTRNQDGGYDVTRYRNISPMEFVIKYVPDGTPIRVYIDEIGEDNDVTEDFEALKEDAKFFVVESAGGGGGFMKIIDPLGVIKFISKLILPNTGGGSTGSLANRQAESPNNSLTDRNNKPRPYERSYDICGTVQTIPNNLMTTYKVFNAAGTVVEYGYYDAGRGPLYVNPRDITDGDTRVQEITGTSAAVYGPYTSPNNTNTPQVQIGDLINQGLYITVQSNEIDGIVLKAPNDTGVDASTMTVSYNAGTVQGTVIGTDAGFDDIFEVGDLATFDEVRAQRDGADLDLSGTYPVVSVGATTLVVDVSSNSTPWSQIASQTNGIIGTEGRHMIQPSNTYEASLTDWVYINRVPVERVLANVAAANGMYKDDGDKQRTSVTVEIQAQMIDDNDQPVGSILTAQGTISGRSQDYTGVTVYRSLPTPSKVRVRMRRVTPLDKDFNGTVVDEVTYVNLYGQSIDQTPHYGNRTTVHSARKQTPRAAEVKQPQLRMVATEMIYKYLGNGVFDTVLTPNTQAVQSLIRLARDPLVGNLNLSVSNMDKLLAVQTEIEQYFDSALAGQFCYTFDDEKTTMQDITAAIAEAIFCVPYRKGPDILLDFERPRPGPEMVFTHRSKTTASEKWTRVFNDREVYDSLEFSYIDPTTNIKETIRIPEEGGLKTEKFDSKGIRNYHQAYWAAHRRHQKNILKKVTVSFTATEEGVFVLPNRPISVVKGSRVRTQDGYVVAVDGLRLTLSQPVTFETGLTHSLILKKREGGVQSVTVTPGAHDREVYMTSAPQEAIYVGNSALKTEFSFGNDSRHNAQMILVSTVDPSDDRTVKITGFNYEKDFYKFDGVSPFGRAFSSGFSNGFS